MPDNVVGIQFTQDSIRRLEAAGYVKVVCRLCGEPWMFPQKIAEGFDADHGFECAYCRRPRVSNSCEAMYLED